MLISLRRFFAKSPRERRTALFTLGAVPLVKRTLRRRGYTGTIDQLARRPRSPVSDLHQAAEDNRVAQGVMRRLPLHMTCLERSLIVWWLVGGSDVAEIRFGVAPGAEGATPEFHAWVEVDGTPLDDAVEVGVSYLPFAPSEAVRPERFD